MPWIVLSAIVIGALAAIVLVVWSGNRMVRNPAPGSAGAADPFGGFVDAFDPARARAKDDLDSREHQIEVTPSPGDEPRSRVDLRSGIARIKVDRRDQSTH